MATRYQLDGSKPSSNIGGRPPALKPEHIVVFARYCHRARPSCAHAAYDAEHGVGSRRPGTAPVPCLLLDDLLFNTRRYINPDVSRSGIARLLKREGMLRLERRDSEGRGRNHRTEEDLQGPRSGFHPHRHQVPTAGAG